MQLLSDLEERSLAEESPFRAQLLREDIIRLRKLEEIVRSIPDPESCRRAARRLGWTALDARTLELAEPLDRLVDAIRRSQSDALGGADDAEIRNAWLELTRLRLETMVGCLSTRLPYPEDE